MRVLLDTNVILDVLLDRAPWVDPASTLWRAVDEGKITGYIMSCALANINDSARRLTDSERASTAVQLCLNTFEICTVDRRTLIEAITLSGRDFEDDMQIACAMFYSLDAIITRDATGFQGAPLSVFTPDAFLETYRI